MNQRLRVNPVACDAHGLCAALLPELVTLDEWGFPVVSAAPVPPWLRRHARRAVAACPVLALALVDADDPAPGGAVGPRRRPD